MKAFVLVGSVLGLNRIDFKGAKMFDSATGEQFFVRGITYQPGGGSNSDALADGPACQRDVPYLKELGVNAIRVYGAHPEKNHDACMAAFEKAGIYLMLDLSIPARSIKRDLPHYDIDILKHYTGNVDAFGRYTNLLGFVAGNEVTNDVNTTEASAHVKAVLRDTKAYIAQRGWKIPVGYVDNDDPAIRKNIQDYFNCGSEEERADFYGINIYSWCGDSDFEKSHYKDRTTELQDYSIPVLLSEYGCNVAATRPFTEILSLYGKDMQDVFSGGFVYEYSYEENKFGLVKINGNAVEKLDDFLTVKSQLSKVDPKKVNAKDYTPSNKARQCPAVSGSWKSNAKLPPTPSEEACQCAYDALTCRVNKAGLLPENGKAVGDQLGYICPYGVCKLVTLDVASGVYGPFATCNAKVVSSIVFDSAFKNGNTCDFNGLAEKATATQRDINQCVKKAGTLTAQAEPMNAEVDEQPSPEAGSDASLDASSEVTRDVDVPSDAAHDSTPEIKPADVTYQPPQEIKPEDVTYQAPQAESIESEGSIDPAARKSHKCRSRK